MEEAKTIINVAGDYVQSKHVDYEINNVEAGGIGIQIINEKPTTPKQSELISSCKGKTVTPKKSTHFLETPALIYTYNSEQFNATKRLTLFYQFLCKEYEPTKTWIDPQTEPDAFLSLFADKHTNDVIVWTTTKQRLYALFKRMKERKIISTPKGYGLWKIVENHFSDWHGNMFHDFNKEHMPEGPAFSAIETFIDILDPAKTTNADLDTLLKNIGKSFGKA